MPSTDKNLQQLTDSFNNVMDEIEKYVGPFLADSAVLSTMRKADLEGHVLSESSGLLSIAAQETAHHNSIAEKNREIVERAERLTAFHERVAHRVKLYVKTVNPYLQRGNPSKIERLLASKYNFFYMDCSVSQSPKVAYEFIRRVDPNDLCELVNTAYGLKGHDRFYTDEGIVKSKYIKSLVDLVRSLGAGKNRRVCITLFKEAKTAGLTEEDSFSAKDMLRLIIAHYNSRRRHKHSFTHLNEWVDVELTS